MTILEQYDRAWRHFDMIAQQRIASFNHYLIVLGVFWTIFLGHFVLGFVLVIYAIGCPKATDPTSTEPPQAADTQSISQQGATAVLPPAQPSETDPTGTPTPLPQKK